MLPDEYVVFAGNRTTQAGALVFEHLARDLAPIFPLHSPRIVAGAAALAIHESCSVSLYMPGLLQAVKFQRPVYYFGTTPPALDPSAGRCSWQSFFSAPRVAGIPCFRLVYQSPALLF